MFNIDIIAYKNYVLFRPEEDEMTPDEWKNFVFFDSETKVKLRHQLFGWDLYTRAEINADKELDYLKCPKMELCFITDGCNPDPDDDICPTAEYDGKCYYYKKFGTAKKAEEVAEKIKATLIHYLER